MIGRLETITYGLAALRDACFGFWGKLKKRVSVAISAGHKYFMREKLQFRSLLKSFCKTDELYRVPRRVPIVWMY